MDDELALLVRSIYSDMTKARRSTRQAFNPAVKVVKQNRPEMRVNEARRAVAVALAVEPHADPT
jgi:hypothetical protein